MVDKGMFRYGEIIHSSGGNVSGSCVMEDGAIIDEAALQAAWAAGVACDVEMNCLDGRTVRVLAPGWHRQDAGPDFGGARIELDGEEISGDVEMELRAAGWYAHGHHLNPRFAKVQLHVFLEHSASNRPTVTIDGRHVPQLCIADLPVHLFSTSSRKDGDGKTVVPEGRCGAGPTSDRSAKEVLTFLGAAGDWRLLEKSCRLDETLATADADTAFYEGIMTALGYRAYKKEFRQLARQLPYALVRGSEKDAGPDEAVETLRAVYLGSAGLLPSGDDDEYVNGLTALWRKHELSMPPLESGYYAWRRAGVRPANRPERRLAAAATLVVRDREKGIAAAWIERIRKVGTEKNAPKLCVEALMVPAEGFWAERYGFNISGTTRGERLIGKARAGEMLVNAVLPAALAVARRDGDEPLRTRVLSVYSRLPKGGENSVTKLMRDRLFPDGLPKGGPRPGARHQQGMLQVYQDWCVGNPGCDGCPMLDNTLTKK